MIRSMTVGVIALAAAPLLAVAQVSLDGVIGPEWTSATTLTVTHNAAAPVNNFGAPTNQTAGAAYNTYFRIDSGWVYFAVATNGTGGSSNGNFSNLYLGSLAAGSNIGFEVTNNHFFVPGGATGFNNLSLPVGQRAEWATNPGVIELAIPFSFFTSDPLGMGFTPTPSGGSIRWNMSQSFGYSVAGGQSFYGSQRLGTGTIPTPGAAALGAIALAGLANRRRRA